MKALKVYLIIVTVLLVIALGFGVYVWLAFQAYQRNITNSSTRDSASPYQYQNNSATDVPSGVSVDREEAVTPPVTGVVLHTDSLTDSQRSILQALGVKDETFVVTDAMISCAQKAVGEKRLDEIIKGAAPTPFESVKMLPCLKE